MKLEDKGDETLEDEKTSECDKTLEGDILPMSPLEGDEEEFVFIQTMAPLEEKGFKTLTPNKLLTRLPVLLSQIKVGNNSSKLKCEIRQILYLLYQHNKITKNLYSNLLTGDNQLVITTKHRTFHFDLSKDSGINLKHEICFIIQHNEFLAEDTIKNEMRQLLSKYKHGNDIHKHGKQ